MSTVRLVINVNMANAFLVTYAWMFNAQPTINASKENVSTLIHVLMSAAQQVINVKVEMDNLDNANQLIYA